MLEAIQVENKHGTILPVSLYVTQRMLEKCVEVFAVGQTGQWIVVSQAVNLSFSFLALGDIRKRK